MNTLRTPSKVSSPCETYPQQRPKIIRDALEFAGNRGEDPHHKDAQGGMEASNPKTLQKDLQKSGILRAKQFLQRLESALLRFMHRGPIDTVSGGQKLDPKPKESKRQNPQTLCRQFLLDFRTMPG